MSDTDQRPPVWIGHVALDTDRIADTAAFMRTLGMRPVFENAAVAIFELRGGTHLVVLAKDAVQGGAAGFDLMVDDLHATHARYADLGLAPSAIEDVPQISHRRFTVREPAGHVITVYSSHVAGAV